eukprot:15239062-Alexandrium_andersonii.AAC.1
MQHRFRRSNLELHRPKSGLKLVPEAPEGRSLRRCFAQVSNLPTKVGLEGVRGCLLYTSDAADDM